MYMATTGTFLQRDPLGQFGNAELLYTAEYVADRMRSSKSPIEVNLYEYCKSNPTNYIDPFGLEEIVPQILPPLPQTPLYNAFKWNTTPPPINPFTYSNTASEGVSPATQASVAFSNGASLQALWDASPLGETGSAATTFGRIMQAYRGEDYGNAARHGYWQAMLTCRYGAQQAIAIGNAHELGNECSPDSRADQFNNNVARQIGLSVGQPCDPRTIRQAVIRALNDGRFITNINRDPRLPPPPRNMNCPCQ